MQQDVTRNIDHFSSKSLMFSGIYLSLMLVEDSRNSKYMLINFGLKNVRIYKPTWFCSTANQYLKVKSNITWNSTYLAYVILI